MWFAKVTALTGLMLTTGLRGEPAAAQDAVAIPDAPVVSYSIRSSSREAGLGFQFEDGSALQITLRGGEVLVDGARVGAYRPGGDLDVAWRRFLAWAGSAGADEAVAAAREWRPDGLSGNEARALDALRIRLNALVPSAPVPPPPPPSDDDLEAVLADASESAVMAREQARALADQIRESVRSSVRESVRDAARSQRVRVVSEPRFTTPIEGVFNGILGLAGVFVALTAIAFGASFFAGRPLDVVADTVSTSLVRSFFVGLFAQPLLLPAFGAMIAGLTLTVIGVLVVPVAIVAFAVALAAALLGGYLAVARVAGSAWMKRRRGDHGVEGFGSLRSVAYGLAILLAIWVPAVTLGWVPVAGAVLTWTALIFTWALVTTGFGAAVLTRGGVRTTFGRRFTPPALPPATLYERPGGELSTAEWMAGR
jgi:hypothetical protein